MTLERAIAAVLPPLAFFSITAPEIVQTEVASSVRSFRIRAIVRREDHIAAGFFNVCCRCVTAAPLPAMRLRLLTSFSISAAGIGCFQALQNHAMQGDIHATTDLAAQTRPSGALRARDVPATRCTLRHVDAASRHYV
jgi:hypothetical protein